MVLLQCVTWSFHTEDPADGRLLHAAPPLTLKPHHSTGLSFDQAAERLGTSPRFIRRLIAERRIGFVKLGRPIRIPMSAIEEFVAALDAYIRWYNDARIKISLSFRSPTEHRRSLGIAA